MITTQTRPEKVFIMGLPNTGKTTVFNALTGSYSVVANYPMTTIETSFRKIGRDGNSHVIYDTPGLHGLFIQSEEEADVRERLMLERPDIIIQCVDVNRLRQSLFFTSDLAELEIPMIIVLTAVDETSRRWSRLSRKRLEANLGIPVVVYQRDQDQRVQRIVSALDRAAVVRSLVRYNDSIVSAVDEILSVIPEEEPYRRKTAMLLLQNDRTIYRSEMFRAASEKARKATGRIDLNINRAVNDARHTWVEKILDGVIREKTRTRSTAMERLAHYSRHPLYGIPILLVFLAVSYLMVVHVANAIADGMNLLLVDPSVSAISRLLAPGLFRDFLIGDYGILTLGLFNAVCTVLPVLSVFFLVFGFMEDIGYLPNLTVLVKRLFKRLGLTGKSIMPLIIGFGCKTMATLTTKSISSRKEKLIAVYLIAFAIPCSAQMALNMAILGRVGVFAFLIAFGFLFLVEIGAGTVLNKLLRNDERSAFIQELSPFRVPSPTALLKKTYYRLLWFLKESIPVFIIAAAVLFLLDLSGILGSLRVVLRPLVGTWLGLPEEMVDALILTMARHEAGAGMILKLSDLGKLDAIQSIIAVVITTMFVPCIANIIAMLKQVGARDGIIMTLSINVSSFILAGGLYWLLRSTLAWAF